MLNEMWSAYGGNLVTAVVGVGIAFVLLIVALRFMRGRNGPSPFIRGGKNRQPRLQVLDAAAVDTRRRLVLVRRDNVEHLIMIGGPTDIVVESGILTSPAGREAVQQVAAARPVAPELQPPAPSFDTERPQPVPVPEPRPVAPQRAAAVPLPTEPRVEPPREAAFAPEPVHPVRQAAAPATTPTAAAVTPKPAPAPIVTPVAAAPLVAPKVEPVVRQPAPEVRTEPLRPIAALAAANAAAQAPANIAVDALESARERVFQPAPTPSLTPALAPEPRILTPITSASMPPALQAAAEKPGQLGNDFERILEQEMASNLAAREAAAAAAADQNRQLPARDPAAPKVTGATPEPTLQAEVARIFGEMSVTRDK